MTFYDIIYKWVTEHFGQSEADDPSWNIGALAKRLSESDIHPDELSAMTKSRVYDALDQHYVEEGVEGHANNNGIKLTNQQIGNVANEIRNSEWYRSINSEDLDWYIKQELKKE